MRDEIHLNDIGTEFLATIKDGDDDVDLSAATTLEFLALPQATGASLKTWTGVLPSGETSKISYVTTINDLDVEGVWSIQAHIVSPAGNWHSDVCEFTVHPVLV